MEVTEAEVGGGSVAAEGVEVAAADEDELGDSEGGGTADDGADVVALGDIMHNDVAVDAHVVATVVSLRPRYDHEHVCGDIESGWSAGGAKTGALMK